MARFAISFLFDFGRHGFSETWYKDTGETNLDVIRDAAVRVAQKRNLLAGKDVNLKGIRIANASDAGRVGKTYPQSFLGNADKPAMASNVAINCKFGTTNNQAQKLVQIRGGWDEWESDGGGLDRDSPTLSAAFASWRAQLVNEQFGWLGISSRLPFNVVGYEVSAGGVVDVTVAYSGPTPGTTLLAAGPVGTRKKVVFSRVNGKSKLNGPQIAYITGATTLRLAAPLALVEYVSGGTMDIPSYTVNVVANGELARLGNRQAGAPLLESVGRRSARPRT